MDLISNGFDMFPRVYHQLVGIAKLFLEGKFKITVLQELWQAFFPETQLDKNGVRPIDLSFGYFQDQFAAGVEPHQIFYRDFGYGGREWTGTVTHNVRAYKRKLTYFISLRMPNDGFIYTETYAQNGQMADNVELEMDNAEALELVNCLIRTLRPYCPKGFKPKLTATYNGDRHKMDVKFHDVEMNLCYVIGWDYGFCNSEARSKRDAHDDEKAQRRYQELASLWEK